MSGQVPGDLLEILVCPQCKGGLHLQARDGAHDALDCSVCGLRYPIEDGIPVMLVEEAQPLDPQAARS
jgi:uncharacterized protein YbaR (Trm112 family)